MYNITKQIEQPTREDIIYCQDTMTKLNGILWGGATTYTEEITGKIF